MRSMNRVVVDHLQAAFRSVEVAFYNPSAHLTKGSSLSVLAYARLLADYDVLRDICESMEGPWRTFYENEYNPASVARQHSARKLAGAIISKEVPLDDGFKMYPR